MKCKLLSERSNVGSQGLESRRSKFARDGKSFGTFECLDGLAGVRAKHTIGFEVSVPKIYQSLVPRGSVVSTEKQMLPNSRPCLRC
jgi:hypothetical protein